MRTKHATRTTLIIGALTILLSTGIVTLAQAQERGGHGRRGDFAQGTEQRLERMAQRLDLTSEQRQAVKKIQDEGRARNQELRKQVMRRQNEKRGELLKDNPEAKTAIELTRKIGDLRTEMQTNRMESRLAVRNLLTPEQKDKMLMFGSGQGRHGPQGHRGPRNGTCENEGPCPRHNDGDGHRNGHGNW